MTTCPSGKIQHATREAALAHQKALVYKNHLAGQSERSKGLGVYPCPECPAWHVGHQQCDPAPLVYHYTVGTQFDKILRADVLRPRHSDAPSSALDEPKPLLWFSWNPHWEYSVVKKASSKLPAWRAYTELCGEGLFRWGAPASIAKLRWDDYLALNRTAIVRRNAMAQYGNPAEWLATDQSVPLSECRTVEAYYRGHWTDDVSDEDFAAYLDERVGAYDAAEQRLYRKVAPRDAMLRLLKGHVSHTLPVPLDRAEMQELHDDAETTLKGLDRGQLDDDAEVILFDDYRLSVQRLGWKLQNWDAIQQWDISQRPKELYQQSLYAARRRRAKSRKARRFKRTRR